MDQLNFKKYCDNAYIRTEVGLCCRHYRVCNGPNRPNGPTGDVGVKIRFIKSAVNRALRKGIVKGSDLPIDGTSLTIWKYAPICCI